MSPIAPTNRAFSWKRIISIAAFLVVGQILVVLWNVNVGAEHRLFWINEAAFMAAALLVYLWRFDKYETLKTAQWAAIGASGLVAGLIVNGLIAALTS